MTRAQLAVTLGVVCLAGLLLLAAMPTPSTGDDEPPDGFGSLRFMVKWEGRYVAGVSKISGLKRTTTVTQHREGAGPGRLRNTPGTTSYEPLVLERVVSQDREFEIWAQAVYDYERGAPGAPDRFRRDVVIDVFNEAGDKVLSYYLYRCWVSEYQALPELDAEGNAAAVESITLQYEGFLRDLNATQIESSPARELPRIQLRGRDVKRGRAAP